ncbi:MAG: alpha/beta fold hydrolase [Elusimicrobia bacterium]|nr:alpha/beta fold hydrolase [Elusimicrobiota bacterium]
MRKSALGFFLMAGIFNFKVANSEETAPQASASTGAVKSRAATTKPELVTFKASDGWTITAMYAAPRKGKPVWILVHGVGAGKGEWGKFAAKLSALGHGALAIDLRGHGESLKGPGERLINYEIFDVTGDWPHCLRDLEAAVVYLKTSAIGLKRIGVMGASIGANLASQLALAHPEITRVALLSPGVDYRGVECVKDIPGRKPLLAASLSDGYSYQSVVALTRSMKDALFFQAMKGHGVQMFDDPDFLKKLLEWVKQAAP